MWGINGILRDGYFLYVVIVKMIGWKVVDNDDNGIIIVSILSILGQCDM